MPGHPESLENTGLGSIQVHGGVTLTADQFIPNWDEISELLDTGDYTGRIDEIARGLDEEAGLATDLRGELEFIFGNIVTNWELIAYGLKIFDITNITADLSFLIPLMEQALSLENGPLRALAYIVWPGLQTLLTNYAGWRREQRPIISDIIGADDRAITDQLARAFTRDGESPFVPIESSSLTQRQIEESLQGTVRENVLPTQTLPFELSIGLCKFSVPPLNVSVNSNFKVTNIVGGSIRQKNTPKFNTGHSETVINLTLYFPNHETIWGFDGEGELDIDFNSDSEFVIDRFMSSLRGLVTAFKYSPFLPIKSEFLNSTFNTTGVTLQSMTVQTLEGFPFVLAVNLTLLKFNHKAYLPMINDFNQAIHWGKYRQYMGRAAEAISRTVGQAFLNVEYKQYLNPSDPRLFLVGGTEIFRDEGGAYVYEVPKTGLDLERINNYTKTEQFNDGRHFQLYYPRNTTKDVFAPDIADFRTPEEDYYIDNNHRDLWEQFMSTLGFDIISPINSTFEYDNVIRYSRNLHSKAQRTELQKIILWLSRLGSATSDQATQDLFNLYFDEYILDYGDTINAEQRTDIENARRLDWYAFVFLGFKNTPHMSGIFEGLPGFTDDGDLIQEWEVPMERMQVDWKKVIVNGVSVTLGNNIARLQLQMQDEPVHQHIGGSDTIINVSMTVIGEEELISFRRVFDHISGLARLEHAHGVLGFLGIKNVVTSLCGVKYVLPLNFDVSTIPGYPHTYSINMSLVDFDIMQQGRENLDESQQTQLLEAFTKWNPFLRLKQLWGVFNAYPDFPLSVKNEEGNTIGHIDPDYYFRSFQMMDDDILHWNKDPKYLPKQEYTSLTGEEELGEYLNEQYGHHVDSSLDNPATTVEEIHGAHSYVVDGFTMKIDHVMAPFTEEQKAFVVSVYGPQIDFGVYDADGAVQEEIKGASLEEDLPERFNDTALSNMQTPYSQYQHAYYDGQTLSTLGVDEGGKGLNPANQFQKMMLDTQYRDISGRMIRAFPTYMLWLIDEGGNFAGTKLFDNFYGLQSVLDFSIVQSEDILGDTLILRLSNIYNKLTKEAQDFISYDLDETRPDGTNPTTNFGDNIVNQGTKQIRNTLSEPPLYVQELSNIRLRPGIRLHLRAGYGSNPNSLQTLFNGTITEVQQGDIMTIIAQSDAIELSPYVNTSDSEGHSGRIDGSFNTGFWLSEPRDLIVRLLSMGSSIAKEAIARASKGVIFSESKFGIRHFGTILYEPMTDSERSRLEARVQLVETGFNQNLDSSLLQELTGDGVTADTIAGVNALIGGHDAGLIGTVAAGVSGFLTAGATTFFERQGVLDLMVSGWVNSFRDRDFEIFKRNIYPGNGTGIMQFAGLDTLDADIYWGDSYAGRTGESITTFDVTQADINRYYTGALDAAVREGDTILNNEFLDGDEIVDLLGQARVDRLSGTVDTSSSSNSGFLPGLLAAGAELIRTDIFSNPIKFATLTLPRFVGSKIWNSVTSGQSQNPIWQALGLQSIVPDDDLRGFDEVSFRAQTYMRTVWDMFQLCADLLPNYIVSVRPFEDRSTVFYGKPHWLYTSGVIPLTEGIPKSNSPVKFDEPNEIQRRILEAFSQIANRSADSLVHGAFVLGLGGNSDPYEVDLPSNWVGGDIAQLPTVHPISGGQIPGNKSKVAAGLEMHLPTHSAQPTSNDNHRQSSTLPAQYRYPFYMDRLGGPKGGYTSTISLDAATSDGKVVKSVLGEAATLEGQGGAFGILVPLEEQYYCLPGDTRIATPTGPVRIVDIQEGQEILSMDMDEDQELIYTHVLKKVCTGVKQKVRIATNNFNLESSPDHPVLTLTRSGTRRTRKTTEYEWIKAGDLKPGDVIVGVSYLHGSWKMDISNEEAYLLGWLLADGSRKDNDSNLFNICVPLPDQRQEVLEILDNVGVTKIYDYDYSCCLKFRSDKINEYAHMILSVKSPDREIPQWLWQQSPVIQEHFILGYMRGDGHVTIDDSRKGNGRVMQLSCSSKKIIEDMYYLARDIGWLTSNPKSYNRSENTFKEGHMYNITLYPDSKKHTVPSSYARDGLRDFPVNNFIARTVTSVDWTDEYVEMYDIEIEYTHNFIANGVVVHNCNMRWPYSNDAGGIKIPGQKSSMFRHKRLLVFNEASGRICICVPGEYGPNAKTGLDMGLSPDAMWYLSGFSQAVEGSGTNFRSMPSRMDNLWIGWVNDETRPGPVQGDISIGSGDQPVSRRGGVLVDGLSPEEIRKQTIIDVTVDYTSEEIADRYTELFKTNADRIAMLDGIEFIDRDGISTLEDLATSNYKSHFGEFINLYGWAFDDINPVIDTKTNGEITGDGPDGTSFWPDTGNATAESTWALMNEGADDHIGAIGGANISIERAGEIWNSMRRDIINNEAFQKVWKQYPEYGPGYLAHPSSDTGSLQDYPEYQLAVAQFLQFMWADPYRRAWATVVVDQNSTWWDAGSDWFDIGSLNSVDTGIAGEVGISFTPDQLGALVSTLGGFYSWQLSTAKNLFGLGPDKKYNLGNLIPVWTIFLDPKNIPARTEYISGLAVNDELGKPKTQADSFMQAYTQPGNDTSDSLARLASDIDGVWDRNVGTVISAIGDLFSSVIAAYQLQMQMMGANLNQIAQMQLQANILNKIFNDSIYYDQNIQNPLVRMADNPFTREYNEPVIEIREPFQRLHYINSFQHIISNNISENLNDVNTVMTATSDGKYPVTVYFDKGAPSERQKEGTVESGIFWDNARGSGWFSFLHPLINPLETSRGIIKNAQGGSDETLSKRIALSHLRESLKDIYSGEILLLGDPDIRPHDLLYLGDVFSRMYGMCEVEQVVHHFLPDQGFTTSVTPNALVTVNDPARWSLISFITGWMSLKDMRDTIRAKNSIFADSNLVGQVTLDGLHDSLQTQIRGSVQYTNGNAALMGDFSRHAKMGLMAFPQNNTPVRNVEFGEEDITNLTPFNVGTTLFTNAQPFVGLILNAFDWVNENLQDQHGCYIAYLNKDGQPMDAGLSYNQGVAVGQWYSRSVLPGLLNIEQRILSDGGHTRITHNDLMQSFGWTETEITGAVRDISYWVNQTNRNILDLTGFGPDPITIGTPNVVMIRVDPDQVIDGDTIRFNYVHDDFDFTEPPSNPGDISTDDDLKLRFSGINTPEIEYYRNSGDYLFNEVSLGTEATDYVQLKLVTEPMEQGYDPVFALRLDASSLRDSFKRVLGVIFHTVPAGTANEDRAEVLYDQATKWPLNPWDSYHDDGRPYTLNWELVTKGLADVYLGGIGIGVKKWDDIYRDK